MSEMQPPNSTPPPPAGAPNGNANDRILPAAQEAYLWDPASTPDTQIAAIERAAAALRSRSAPGAVARRETRSWRIGMAMATAAMLTIATGIGVWTWHAMGTRTIGGAGTTWRLVVGTGVRVGEPVATKSALFQTSREVTAGLKELELRSGKNSVVTLSPGTRATIYEGTNTGPSLDVRSGTATIRTGESDPAIVLFPGRDSARIEPGSAAEVDEGKAAPIVRVLAGTAKFVRGKSELRITRGGSMIASAADETGLPWFDGETKQVASEAREYVRTLRGKFSPQSRESAIARTLDEASAGDAATLWNVMQLAPREDAQRIGERIAVLLDSGLVKKDAMDYTRREVREMLWDEIVAARTK